ncbi:unnamed protein product [Phaedon cochleariae]|uniref:Glutathione synthetase n=1 Tax=Phaedon cochleariae TaxID=80249 RepID=A0A9N9SEG9_PHACE|nr:unnamed protein product [Phaedon cochleariae]
MRSDYMLDSTCDRKYHSDYPPCDWKQVEYNTIAAGFYWLGPVSGDIHRYVFQELGYDEQLKNLPENNALAGLSESLIEAWRLYGNPEGAILFVVEKVSYNICDQRFPEFKIRELNPQVKVIRRTIDELGERSRLNQNGELVIDNLLINVIYYRIGYEPASYPTQKQWDTRLLLERSKAIKCPTIHYHLAGAKKVQQELSRPGALERFLDEKQVEMVRDIFVGLYALDINEEGEKTIEMALKNPERYVLKPQREGGGNNIYGAEIREELLRMRDSKERTAWILMDRICPPITKGYMIRPGASTLPPILEMVSELGIFGVLIGNSEEILSKKQLGHMLRTKIATANEGGVAAGDGSLDSPYLLD